MKRLKENGKDDSADLCYSAENIKRRKYQQI